MAKTTVEWSVARHGDSRRASTSQARDRKRETATPENDIAPMSLVSTGEAHISSSLFLKVPTIFFRRVVWIYLRS
jgi:hypothetical protein